MKHQEEIVGVVVRVPIELALHLHDHQIVPVEAADDLGRPEIGEGGELFGEVDGFGHIVFAGRRRGASKPA